MTAKDDRHPLGVFLKDEEVFLFFASPKSPDEFFQRASSNNGLDFTLPSEKVTISGEKPKGSDISKYTDFRIAKIEDKYFLTYKLRSKKETFLYGSLSSNLVHFQKVGKIDNLPEVGMITPDYKYKGRRVLYFGEDFIKIAFSKDLKTWQVAKQFVLAPRGDYFDGASLQLGNVATFEEAILVTYYVKQKVGKAVKYLIGAALFDPQKPQEIFWRSPEPLWEQPSSWQGKDILPLGAVFFQKKLVFYWKVGGQILAVFCPLPQKTIILKDEAFSLILKKYEKNPIIEPIPEHSWESRAAFNSAAIFEEGRVHFLYRAIGDSDISVLGYASSSDGLRIDERLPDPAYILTEPFECPAQPPKGLSPFVSGAGYGGCEDPRLTKIGDRIYMTYVAFDGVSHPRAALTSIAVEDFLAKRWVWEKPILISPPGIVNKNACLLPEKVKGKYVVFHRVFPNILIDFVDDLSFDNHLEGDFAIAPRENSWDSLKVGAGPPPLKTEDGWLLIYHAVGLNDRGRYKIGAMLLDLENPQKVLCRSNYPILEPSESYENEGFKAGVAYPCGAAIVKGELIVYYGGADMVLCAARQNLKTFLSELKSSHEIKLEPLTKPLNFFN